MEITRCKNITIRDVYNGDELGQFRAGQDQFGWKSDNSGLQVAQWGCNVQTAEWFEGDLRLTCEDDVGEQSVLTFSGFVPRDFETLWQHFSTNYSVYIKRRKAPTPAYTDSFDDALKAFEIAADSVDAAIVNRVVKKAKEANFLIAVERIHNGLESAVKGDKQTLSNAFAADGCERIGRLRLVFDTVQLDAETKRDARWQRFHRMIETVESILRELDRFRVWRPGEENSSMSKRHAAREHQDQSQTSTPSSPSSSPRKKKSVVQSNPLLPAPAPVSKQVFRQKDGLDDLLSALQNFSYDASEKCVENGSPRRNSNVAERVAVVYRQPTLPFHVTQNMDDMGMVCSHGNSRAHYTRWDSVREGWIWKKSRYLGVWRKRWFILTPSGLEFLVEADGSSKRTEFVNPGSVQKVHKDSSEHLCLDSTWWSLQLKFDNEYKMSQLLQDITEVLVNGQADIARRACWGWACM